MKKRIIKLLGIATVTVGRDASFFTKFKAFVRMLLNIVRGRYKTGKRNFIFASLVLLYIISPIDLIPDFLLPFGLLDDLALLVFGTKFLDKEILKYLAWEKSNHSNKIEDAVIIKE